MYHQCPTETDGIVDYLNNHNGGLFNKVEPSVNQEVAPILSSIVSDVIGGGGTSGSQTSSRSSSGGLAGLAGSDSSFRTIDKLISTALIDNAAEMLTGASSSSSASS